MPRHDGPVPHRPALFVVISGPPASGKSTIAPSVAEGLQLPLLAKDVIKGVLLEALGAPDIETSRRLGTAAVAVLLAVARHCPEGAVLESVFDRSRAAAPLRLLPGPVMEVFCRCDRSVAEQRYRRRTGSRAEGHFDADRQADELWNAQISEPVAGGWPVLEVDTNRSVDIAHLVDQICKCWEGHDGRP